MVTCAGLGAAGVSVAACPVCRDGVALAGSVFLAVPPGAAAGPLRPPAEEGRGRLEWHRDTEAPHHGRAQTGPLLPALAVKRGPRRAAARLRGEALFGGSKRGSAAAKCT